MLFIFRGTHSPFVFHVKENVAGAIIGHIFPVNSSSFSNNSGNIKFIIANQQDVADEISIGIIFCHIQLYEKII